MPTAEIPSQVDKLLEGVAQLAPPDFERFFSQVLMLRANRNPAPAEAVLLERINKNLTSGEQQRYDALTAKQRHTALTPEEHRELLALVDIIEDIHLGRVEALTALAQLRQTSCAALADELDFPHCHYA